MSMNWDAEDWDHTTFVEMASQRGPGKALSIAATNLHIFAYAYSDENGHPGFITDEYLNALDTETTMSAVELCVNGYWQRSDGGYQNLDPVVVDYVASKRRESAPSPRCQWPPGCEPSDDDLDVCGKCGRDSD